MILLVVVVSLNFPLKSQSIRLTELNGIQEASYRAISIVDETTAWVAGSNGMIGRTRDAGSNWEFMQIAGQEKLDFRSIHAFSYDLVMVANAGSPARIFRTADGGNTWSVAYRNDHPDAFLDAISFFDGEKGLAVGDPIDGKLLLLSTLNGGISWFPVPLSPAMGAGEAVFAASGTSMRSLTTGTAMIGTGGSTSRILMSNDFGQSWIAIPVPGAMNKSSAGIFSLWLNDARSVLGVGGDYEDEKSTVANIWLTQNGGKKWTTVSQAPGGYRSCVEAIGENLLMAVGPSGADLSSDKGKTWSPVRCPGGHVIRSSPQKKLILMAGKDRIWRVEVDR